MVGGRREWGHASPWVYKRKWQQQRNTTRNMLIINNKKVEHINATMSFKNAFFKNIESNGQFSLDCIVNVLPR